MGTIFSKASPRRALKTTHSGLRGYKGSPGIVLQRGVLRARRARAGDVGFRPSPNSKSEAYSAYLLSSLIAAMTLSVNWTASVSKRGSLAGVTSAASISAAGETEMDDAFCADDRPAQATERAIDLISILNEESYVWMEGQEVNDRSLVTTFLRLQVLMYALATGAHVAEEPSLLSILLCGSIGSMTQDVVRQQ
jgi:hypothetical protein